MDDRRDDGVDAKLTILVDPLSVLMICVVAGVSMLIHLYSVSYLQGDRGYARFFAYLNFFVFSMLLLVLAGNFVLLIVGWAFVGAASYMLISFWYRRNTATSAGIKAFVINVRRRRRARARHVLHLPPHPHARLRRELPRRAARVRARQRRHHRGLPAAARRRVREVGADPAAHLAPGRDGGPDPGQRADPRRDDGDRRRLPDRAHAPALPARARRRRRRRDHRRRDAAVAGTIGLAATDLKRVIAYSTMSQIGYMIMGVSVGAYTAGLFHLMTHAFFKALLFMAAGSMISGDGRRPVARPDVGPAPRAAVHLRLLRHRRPRAVGRAAVQRLLLEGLDPAVRRRPRRLALGAVRRRVRRARC